MKKRKPELFLLIKEASKHGPHDAGEAAMPGKEPWPGRKHTADEEGRKKELLTDAEYA